MKIYQESEKERLMPSFLAKRVSESHHEASKKLSGLEKTKAFSRPLQVNDLQNSFLIVRI